FLIELVDGAAEGSRIQFLVDRYRSRHDIAVDPPLPKNLAALQVERSQDMRARWMTLGFIVGPVVFRGWRTCPLGRDVTGLHLLAATPAGWVRSEDFAVGNRRRAR